jgi:hypothetical protein
MIQEHRSRRNRSLRPILDSLENRALLNAAMPKHVHAQAAQIHAKAQDPGSTITIINKVKFQGHTFVNFDGPNAGTNAGTGTNMNGIANSGTAVGFTIDNNGNFLNFAVNPLKVSKTFRTLNINNSTTAMAFGINSEGKGLVVGTDGNGNAFLLVHGKVFTSIPNGGNSAAAFGINDRNAIVGQYVTATTSPGFIRVNAKSTITINAPSGPDIVNAQGINNKGLVVGFFVGTDGQDHGFIANGHAPTNGTITGTAVADPTIPVVPGEPAGTTFVFSQILGINDHGIAVGYYGDSTGSQHGFFFNTKTGKYTFLDDPNEAFNNGVEVTQITGINNSNEITGFYTDANGVAHGFVAVAHT